MKKNYFLSLLVTICFTWVSLGQDLLITGVFDGPLSGGTPKGVELYVVNNIADLSIYGIGSANNGGGSDGEEYEFPADAVNAGSYIYVTANTSEFNTFFGFAADYDAGSAMGINGDDAIELFMNDTVVDVFGDINTDGSGELWDYLDGWAYRKNGRTASATFVVDDWSYSGINVFDGESTNSTASTPLPIGTYSTMASTEPAIVITSPSNNQIFQSTTTEVPVTLSIDNFTVSGDAGGGVSDNTGDGYLKTTLQETGETDVVANFFTASLTPINVVPGKDYTATIELVDNSGNSLNPKVEASVSFSVLLPCDIQLSTIMTSCDAETQGTDNFTTTIDFSGGNTGVMYTITAKDDNDNDVGTVGGANPNNIESGQIIITGVPEGTDFTVKVIGGSGSSCDLTRNINAPTCLPASCAATGSIIITEIMQNPSKVNDDRGEYFEVYNTTNNSLDLQGWVLKAGSTSSPSAHTIASSVIVPANGYVVFGENADSNTNGGVSVDYQYDAALFLGNGSSKVVIECGGNVIDDVTYDNGATFPDPNGKSMELSTNKYSATDNDDGANWGESTTDLGNGDFGTPGTVNSFTLSIVRNEIEGFALYPNPVRDGKLNIRSNSTDKKQVSIFNVLGKNVLNATVTGTNSEINVSSISSGVYILKVIEGTKTATSKLVIR